MIKEILSASRLRPTAFAEGLLKMHAAGKEECDVLYWECQPFLNVTTMFSTRNLKCVQKSTENKGMANFTVKDILLQGDKMLFGKKLIVPQNRKLDNRETLSNEPYSLCTIKLTGSNTEGWS